LARKTTPNDHILRVKIIIKGCVVIFTVKFSNTNVVLFLQRFRIALEFVDVKFRAGYN